MWIMQQASCSLSRVFLRSHQQQQLGIDAIKQTNTNRKMRNVTVFLFTLAISCGSILIHHVDAFHVATTIQKKKCSLIHRHVGVSHIPDYEFGRNAVASTPTFDSTLNPIQAAYTKYAMISFISHLCIALPMVLLPTFLKNKVMTKLGLQTKSASEHEALQVSQKCASILLKLIPFMNLQILSPHIQDDDEDPVPTIWVSNHVSMLDTFIFLSSDEQLRGKNRRPIKTIYVSIS